MTARWLHVLALLALLLPATSARAEWSWLRSENSSINAGNEKLKAGDAKGALEAYDRAAQQLPSEGGVHLNRGLALLKQNNLPAAREALRLATQSRAAGPVRPDAHYNLGLAFYKEADQLAAKDDPEQAQQLFRESADAFKQALRLRPADRNTAWNYELALRRIQEQKDKQKQKEDQQKQDQDQQKQDQDQQNQDQNQDQQNQDQDQQKQDPQNQDQQQPDQQKQDQAKQDPPKQDQPKDQQQQQQDQQQQAQQQPQPRPEVDRALDALQDSEENLERRKAMQRAAGQSRQVEMDW